MINLFLYMSLLLATNMLTCSQETQTTQVDSMFSLNSQDFQFEVQSYHASEQGTQVNDGYDYDLSSLLHQPTPTNSQEDNLNHQNLQYMVPAVSQEHRQGNTLYRAAHVNGVQTRRSAIVSQETDNSSQNN